MFDSTQGAMLLFAATALSQRRANYVAEGCWRTPGYYALALYAQGAGQPEAGTGQVNTDIISLIAHAGPVAKGVLAILLIFSAVSWGVVFYKVWQFGRVRPQASTFLDVFRTSSKFSEVAAVCRTLSHSPLVGLFQAGYAELNS